MTGVSTIESEALTEAELVALRGAGVWYANYHARAIAQTAGDQGSYAVGEREEYRALIAALNKLGVRLRAPDAPVLRPSGVL